ncbi:hypothetical protein MP478_04025 [Chryseobacterium sp. WG14]|uniref:hypothetical protein n=1 Tax=Chryseobacterium sp. WG14 TaxID=2926909 RepID=UPI00211ED45A|nr:hypothetical protein [Chryseobacterium sp. WG14]MCQ9638546.1 hypothetical protein [Chryseobacterium sp. WG14]
MINEHAAQCLKELLELENQSNNIKAQLKDICNRREIFKKEIDSVANIYYSNDTKYSEDELSDILISIHNDFQKIDKELQIINDKLEIIDIRMSECKSKIAYFFN